MMDGPDFNGGTITSWNTFREQSQLPSGSQRPEPNYPSRVNYIRTDLTIAGGTATANLAAVSNETNTIGGSYKMLGLKHLFQRGNAR